MLINFNKLRSKNEYNLPVLHLRTNDTSEVPNTILTALHISFTQELGTYNTEKYRSREFFKK